MVDIDIGGTEITVTSPMGGSLSIGVGGWRKDDTAAKPSVEGEVPIDESISGHVTRLRFYSEQMNIEAVDIDLSEHVDETGREFFEGTYGITDSTTLPRATYRIQLPSGSLVAYVEFEAWAEVRRRSEYEWELSFDHPTQVAIGFRDTSNYPRETITVPATPTGLSRAITTFPASLRTTTPDRSFPSLRVHPPRVEFEDHTEIPETVQERAAETRTDIEIEVPDRLPPLFVLAPLAYYLGATVTVADRETPIVRAPTADVDHQLPACPDLQQASVELLQRVFWLDCLVRNAGPHGTDLLEVSLAREAGFDPDLSALYEADPAERLRRYLDLDVTALDSAVPTWPSAICVDPTIENARALPYIVNDLSTVYLAAEVDDIGDPTTENASRPPTKPPTPGPNDERTVGWLAEDPPADAFEADVGAMQRWPEYADTEEGTHVVVVGADSGVAERFRTRGKELDRSAHVEEHPNPSRDALRSAFESAPDLVYYSGEVTSRGIECADGTVTPADLPLERTGVVVLDVPDSLTVGRKMIASGCLGTIALTETAPATIGTTPAELLLHGLSVSDAVWIGQRYAETDASTRILGAGRQTIPSMFDHLTHINSLQYNEPSSFVFDGILLVPHPGGLLAFDPAGSDSVVSLDGRRSNPTVPPDRIFTAIDETVAPMAYDGEIHWPDDRLKLTNPLL